MRTSTGRFAFASLLLWWLICPMAHADDAAAKLPVPDRAAQKESQELVADVYKQDFAAIRKPGKKAELAKRLLEDGKTTENSPVAQYVLLSQARELAAEAADGPTAFAAIGELEKRYNVDGLKLRSDTLQAMAKASLSTPQAQFVADSAKSLMAAAIQQDELAIAESALDSGTTAARKGKLPKVSKDLAAQVKYVQFLRGESDELSKAKQVLTKDAADPDASSVVGRYACLHQDDWEAGLELLVQGSDEALAAIAKAELAPLDKPTDRAALGDLWWAALESQNPFDQARMRLRSAHWYRLAAGGLTGLDKAKVERRLKSIATSEQYGIAASGSTPRAVAPVPADAAGAGRPLQVSSKLVMKIPGLDPDHGTMDIAFSPDGKLVAAVDNQKIRVHEVATGENKGEFAGPAARAWSIAFSHDGKYLVAGYIDNSIRIWDVLNTRLKTTIEGSQSNVVSVAFSPDDTLVVSSDNGLQQRLWRASGKQVGTFEGNCSTFWPNKNRLVIAKSGSVTFHNATSGATEATIAILNRIPRQVLVSPDAKTLAIVYIGGEQKVGLFDIAKGIAKATISTSSSPNSAAFSADGTMIAVSQGHIITIWSARTGQELDSINPTGFAFGVAWSPNGRTIAFGGRGVIELWDVVVE